MPWNEPVIVSGILSSATAPSRRSTAWLSDTPGARLNDTVTAGTWPRWLIVAAPTEVRNAQPPTAARAAPFARMHIRTDRARSDRSGVSDRPASAPRTDRSRCRSSTPAADRTRCRAHFRSGSRVTPTDAAASRSILTSSSGVAISRSLVTSWKPSQLGQRGDELRHEREQLLRVGVLQHVLVVRFGQLAADADDRQILRKRLEARNALQLRAEFLHDFVGEPRSCAVSASRSCGRDSASRCCRRRRRTPSRCRRSDPCAGFRRLRCCLRAIASKPMSCAACVNTNSWPVSSFGRNPFGTSTKSTGRRDERDEDRESR